MTDYTQLLGFIAAFCTTVSFLPQAIKVIRTKDTESLSLGMYSIFTLGLGLWLLYGLMREDLAIIIANIVTITLAGLILAMKIRNDVFLRGDKKHVERQSD